MIYAGVIIGLVILGAMVYLALDKKSSLTIRFASLGAIAIMFIAVVICVIIVLSDNTVPVDPSALIVGAPAEVKETKNNAAAIAFSIIFVIVLFVFIAILAMKEHKKNLPKTKDADASGLKPASDW
jgi:NADH:ubiquinone oxidoreductase subunit 6 (subunit J)